MVMMMVAMTMTMAKVMMVAIVIAGWPAYLPEHGMEWPPIVLRLSALTSNPWSVEIVIRLCQNKCDPFFWHTLWQQFADLDDGYLWIFRWKTQPENIQVKDPDLKVTVLSNEGGGRLSFSCPQVATLSCVQMSLSCVFRLRTDKFDLHFLISWLKKNFLDSSSHCFSLLISRASQWLLSWLLNVYLHCLSLLICRASQFFFAGLLNSFFHCFSM